VTFFQLDLEDHYKLFLSDENSVLKMMNIAYTKDRKA